MLKKLIMMTAVSALLAALYASPVLAAPEKLTGEEKSTADLVELSKPEEDFSTFSNTCIVSGVSKEDVKLYIYIKNEDEDTYEKLIVDNKDVTWVVGPSGIFVREIGLERNTINRLLIYAEKEDDFQIILRNITVKNLSLKEILKNEVVRVEDIISRILNK